MIALSKKLILGKGSERICYIHPLDKNKVIKIFYNQKSTNNQNILEYKYFKFLEKKNVNFSHITKCYYWLETNLGKGLVFHRILNYDNTNALGFQYFLKNKKFSFKEENELLEELRFYLVNNNILFTDATTINVICQKINTNKYKLIIIDGLGAKRKGLKLFLYTFLPFYTQYKIKKQWQVFLANVQRVKNKST